MSNKCYLLTDRGHTPDRRYGTSSAKYEVLKHSVKSIVVTRNRLHAFLSEAISLLDVLLHFFETNFLQRRSTDVLEILAHGVDQ